MPIYGSGTPQAFADALRRAETRFPDASWGLTLFGEEWQLLAACGAVEASRSLPRCVENNARLAAVLDHEVEELHEAMLNDR